MRQRVRVLALAAGVSMLPSVLPMLAAGASATNDDKEYKAGLVTLCSTDRFVRVGGLNDSDRDVTISLTETDAGGKAVSVLGSNASDQLKAIFPITIPANSKYAVSWDLPYPATVNGVARGSDHQLHGSWNPARWADENGRNYRGTGGTAGKNGSTCSTTPTTTTTTTSIVPVDPAQPIKAVGWFSTSNSQRAAAAFDADPSTAFTTQMLDGSPATWAWVRADLGKVVPLRTISWTWSQSGAADDFRIEASTDARRWTVLAEPTADAVGMAHSLAVETDARFVRFYWRNPSGDTQLGYLAEASFTALPTDEPQVALPMLGKPATPPVMPPAPQVLSTAASPLGERISVVTSRRSSNSPDGASTLALDRDESTAYATSMSVAPWTGWTSYDLGGTTHVGRVRWQFDQVGIADYYRVQVSEDGITWATVRTLGNALQANEWQTLLTDVDARYVRFFFINVNGDANVGGLSEVRFYRS